MSLVQQGRKELKLWSCRLAAYELAEKVSVMIMQNAEVPEAGDAAGAAELATTAPTTRRRPDVVDKVVRAQCENSLVVGVYLLSCPLARRRLATFVEVADSVERWYAAQSTRCRSVASNKDWFAEQASGK